MSVQANGTVKQMMGRLRELLHEDRGSGIELTIADDGYVEEGGWVHFIVTPARPGIHALEYVQRLQDLERKLRQEFDNPNILLLPAWPD